MELCEVLLDGRAVHRTPAKELARTLGLLPQSPIAPEGITVADLVGRGRHPHQGIFSRWNREDDAAVAAALEATQTVEIPVGREVTVYFTVRTADTEGNVRFVATAAGNGEQSRSTTNVGIRADLPEVSVENAGAVGSATLEVPAKEIDQFRPETVRRTVRISPYPLVQFAGKLEHLLHYPYGCLEQTTSSAFPLIYIGDIAKALDPALLDPKKGRDPAAMVQAGLRRIATMQLPGGGFTLWPGGRDVHLWGSLYATHFLVEAKRAGHP